MTLQVPAHQAIVDALQLLPGPVVATPLINANLTTQVNANLTTQASTPGNAHQAIVEATLTAEQNAVDRLAFAVDDGPTHFGGLSTILRVDGHTCGLTDTGVLDQNVLIGLGQLVVLLVCTGNTCRSPDG